MRTSLVLVSLFASLSGTFLAASSGTPSPSSQAHPQAMPRYFEANRGQWPASQAFRAYGYGYGIALGKDGVTLQVANPKAAMPIAKTNLKGLPNAVASATPPREVSLRFEGASAAAQFSGQEELAAKGAWFQGAEANWKSNISLFERVREAQVYAGVDATFYGRDGQLEYDLDVAPGAKTDALVFDLDGADKASIAKNGDLTIEVDGQQIVLHKPLAWQPDGTGRKTVEVSYTLLAGEGKHGQRVGLGLKGYDAAKPLTIDPVLTFATYLPATNSSQGFYVIRGIAVDSANSVYVLSQDSTSEDVFAVQKVSSAGTLQYTATFATTVSGGSNIIPSAIRVNASGQAYVAASDTAGYPTTSNAYQPNYPNASYGGNFNAALSVISADGSTLVYSTYFGGTANGSYGPDNGYALAVDSAGNAYLAGQAGGGNFPTTAGAYLATYTNGYPAGFVAKFNPSAQGHASLLYSTLLGGTSTYVEGMAVDGAGDADLAVYSGACNGPVTSGAFAYSGIDTNTYCGYVTSVNPAGSSLVYSAFLGPVSLPAIAVDGSQDVYVAGGSIGADDLPTTSGAYQTSYPDGFAAELNPTGGLIYATFLSGPSGGSRANAVGPASIALAPGCISACSAYITGETTSADFPVINGLSGAPPADAGGWPEDFLVALNGSGSAALTSGYIAGLNTSVYSPSYVALDSLGNAWIAGTTYAYPSSIDFPVTTSVPPSSTNYGAWLAEVSMNNAGNVIPVPNSVNFGTSVPVNVSSTAYDLATAQPPTTVALRNMGSAPVTLTSIFASPSYFAETDNCNGAIPAASYCTATVSFTPPNDAPVTGTLTITSNGLNSTQVIPLSGQGSDVNFLVASPAALNFGNVTVNTTSAAQVVTITNQGNEPLVYLNTIYFSTTTGFTGLTNCPAALPSGDSCQISVTFSPGPTQVGVQTGTLYSPYYGYLLVNISGTGVLPSSAGGTNGVSILGSTLNFGTLAVGTASAQQSVYIQNQGSLTLGLLPPTITLTSGQGSAADFQIANPNTSVNYLAPQVQTQASVYFTPSVAATETATLTYAEAGSSTLISISLIGQGAAATQLLEFQPGNAIFPDQPVGTASATQGFNVFNAGNTPFVVDRAIGSGDFTVTQTNCPGYNLAPATAPGDVNGSYCYVYVTFTPTQTGARTGTLTLVDAASTTPQTIPLSGNGIVAAGVFTPSPTQLDFGAQVKGTSSAVQYVTPTNSGNVNINFTAAATTGDYAITYNNCGTPYTIPPGPSPCQIGVTFTPTVTTSPDNGTLVLTTSAGSQTITLTGGGEAATLASGVSPTTLNFGSETVGTTTSENSTPVFVRNSGTEMLTFSTAATVTGDYNIWSDYCNTSGSGTLAPGQDCPIYVYFAPTASGARTGTLTVKSNAGTLTASLSGTGTGVGIAISSFYPAEQSFDQQAVNSISSPATVNFYYAGTNPTFALTGATITAGSANFQLASGVNALNTCTAAQGSTTSCQINVVFSPTTSGYHTGTLTVTSNLGNFSVTLSGYAPPVSDTGYLSPGALSFPSQTVGTTSPAYQQVYLYNTGAAAMTVGTVTGTNFGSSSEFQDYSNNPAYDYCSGQVLAPANSTTADGGNCYILVQFTPSGAGTRTGTISFPVTYSDNTTGTFTANLTGLGVAQKNEAVLSPTVATFTDTTVGTESSGWVATSIYLTNSGNLPFTVGTLVGTNVVVGSTSSGDFTTARPYQPEADNCSGATVGVGSYCNITVTFAPTTAGARTGTVTFPVTYANSTTPVNFTATLTGNGIAAYSAVAVSPAGIQFDSTTVNAGVVGNVYPITATNIGNLPVSFTKATLSAGFGNYNDQCTGISVPPGGNCTIYVDFLPTTTGTITGTLSITDTAAGSPQKVALSGVSLAATSELQFSQTTVSFGNVLLGSSSNQYTVYLINRGTDAVTINSIALAGADYADYTESDGCAGNSLPANSTCSIYLTFAPTATGSRTATLTETDTGSGGPRTINISGSGINSTTAITFFPAALTFSSTQPVGEGSAEQFFSVNNLSPNAVTISAVASTNAAVFPVAQDGCTGSTLYSGQSCLIVVLFTPTATGSASAHIKITDNATGSPQQFPVSGTAVSPLTSSMTLAANPTSGAFGSLFTFTATVKDQNSNPVTNGTVTFYDGTTVIGTAQVVSTTSGGGVVGTATLKTILIPLGANSISAKYVGADVTSSATAVSVTVTGKYPTTTTFNSAGNPGDYIFTGTVQGAGPVLPTGSILFTDTTTGLEPGTATINSSTLAQAFVSVPDTNAYDQYAVAFADLNGDGIPDLVMGTSGSGLLVQLGNGDGTFQAPQQISTSSVSSEGYFGLSVGASITFGDFNGDGKVDIAFVACNNSNSPCAVGVLLGNGDGTFQKERFFDQTSSIPGIVVGDFNGDGILDIAAANYGNGTVDVLLGNGDGSFQEPLTTAMPGASSVAVGDVNGDGKLDLVVTNWGYSTVSVLLGNGNGTFQAAASYSTPASPYPNNATLASLRSNGKLDIVIEDYVYSVSALLNNGNGTFLGSLPVYSPTSPSSVQGIAVADVTGDGKPDLLVADGGRVEVSVLNGNGDGTFQDPNSYPTGAGPEGVAIADLNHDGRPDLAVANTYGNAAGGGPLSILLNQVTQTATLSGTTVPGSGNHAVSGTYSGDTNFAASTSNSLQLAASLVASTISLQAEPSSTVMWGQQLSVNVTLSRPLTWVPAQTGTVGYSIDSGAVTQVGQSGGSVSIPISQLSVGNHTIAVTYVGDQYYKAIAAQSISISIIKANQTITFGALPGVTYGVAPITLSATSTSGLPVSFSITSGPGTLSGTNNSLLTVTGAGSIVIAANQSGNIDYNAATAVPETQTVAKAPLTVVVNSASKVYGAALPTFGGTITGLVNGDTVTATYSSTGTATSPAGTYPITVTLSGSAAANYAPTITNGTLTITKAGLTVTANPASRSYGAANPVFTDIVTGFVNGDTLATAVTGAASLTTTATAASPVGSYTITTAAGTLAAANYTFTFANSTLTVNKAVLTVTANAASSTYGSANPTFADTITGFFNGDTVSSATTGAASLTTTATASSPAGVYTITAAAGTLAATNYTFTFVNGTLTVSKAVLTVTANAASRTYGAANPTFTDMIAGFVNGDTLATAVTGAASLTTTATASSAAGTYTITAAAGTLAATNYSFAFVNGALTVNKAVLTVTAISASRNYGSANPTFTDTITGFVNGDTAATAVTGAASLTTTATTTSAAGSYTITAAAGTLAATNYTFTFVNGTLTVNPVALVKLSATSLAFGSSNAGTATASQSVTLTNTGDAALSISSIAVTGANASSYAFTNTCGASVAVGATCTITGDFDPVTGGSLPATFTVTDNAPNSPQSIALTGTGLGPAATLSVTSVAFGSEPVGSSTATDYIALTNTGNATLTITSIAVTGPNASSFPFGNGCAATLAAGANCSIHGHFNPTANGPLTAAITIVDNAGNSPQTVALSGTGLGPAVSLSATSLSFGSSAVGTATASQSVTLTNTGQGTLSITGIAVTGANATSFAFTNTCGTSVAAGASCSITGDFDPTTGGALAASVAITDNAGGSPQSIALTGTGLGPAATLSVSSLSFGSEAVGSFTASQSVTLTNTGSAALSITSIALTGANASSFTFANSCGTSLAAGANCSIHGHFNPVASGPLTAAITIVDNAGNSPQTVALSGTGQ